MMLGLNTTCDIYRATRTANDYGEEIPSWSREDYGVPCRFVMGDYAKRVELKAAGGADSEVSSHMAVFDADIDVEPGDQLKWKGVYYNVLSADDVDDMGHHIECYVARVEGV